MKHAIPFVLFAMAGFAIALAVRPGPDPEEPAPITHATRAAAFVANAPRAHWHDSALWYVRKNRDAAARAVPDWEALRDAAAAGVQVLVYRAAVSPREIRIAEPMPAEL